LLGNVYVNTPVARKWLSSDHVFTLTDINAAIEDAVFYTVRAGGL
jgi:hypothetical protein